MKQLNQGSSANAIWRPALIGTLLLLSTSALPASIIFTREAPGVQETSVVGATTETFDALPLGSFGPFVSPIGTYSAGGAIVAADAFGGAHQTTYISVGIQSGAVQYDLTLGGLRTYLGFYWLAGDTQNRVDFYNGATLQGTFSVGDIIAGLPAAYFGNPNTGQNPSEPYVYLNFTSSDLASRFDRVVFRNLTTTTGFETDNHSVFDAIITPPGIGTPEPSSCLLVAAVTFGFFLQLKRRGRQA